MAEKKIERMNAARQGHWVQDRRDQSVQTGLREMITSFFWCTINYRHFALQPFQTIHINLCCL